MPNKYDDLQQSYGRCLREKNFIERFYEIFLESHSSIRPMFEKTDFQTQRMALRHGISAAISYASGSSLTKRTMDQMAEVHSRTGHAPVSPDLYPYWIESLVNTVKEVDPQASPELLARWREGMKIVTDDFSKRF